MAVESHVVLSATPTTPRILDDDFRLQLSDNARYMLRFRYLLRDEDGTYETPEEMFRRVAWNLAEAEKHFGPELSEDDLLRQAETFFVTMTESRYLPNAPTLLGAGGPSQQLHACFVLPIEDSIEGIFHTLKQAAIVHSRGAGTGYSFSDIRPSGAPISTGGLANGPVPFLHAFDAETQIIKNGGTGWGANMAVLRCDHPDIKDFVTCKTKGRELTNFNISVGITDEFLDHLLAKRPFPLRDPSSRKTIGAIDPEELLELISLEAWKTGDPGLLFLDSMERDNPTPQIGALEATNPCAEAPLLPYEACCLGGVNLASHYDRTAHDVDWNLLEETCQTALRMMDNSLEASRYPLQEIEDATRRTRKVGIGVMGFADLLILLGIPYDSSDSERLAERIMRGIKESLDQTSIELAKERGAFPAFNSSVFASAGAAPRRNATTTANPPNSTISVIAGCSAGVEPIFSLAYQKRLSNGDSLQEINPYFLSVARERGFLTPRLMSDVASTGTIRGLGYLPDDVKRLFVTAHDISPTWHVRIQGAFQRHTDLGVAKTINLDSDATVTDVRDAFLLAHEMGCKGITCFRDGCRETSFLCRRVEPASSEEVCPVCS